MLVLVIGDLHLPHRASDLPSKFRKLLVPGKIQQIICTGNVCDRETLDYLRTIAGDVHVVRGDWDENPYFANSIILQHAPLRIGVLHGHQIIPPGDPDSQCSVARSMDVDILITGHTHKFDAFERDGRFFVNPGSATGAWSSVWPLSVPEDEEVKENSKPAEEEKKAEEGTSSGDAEAKEGAVNGTEGGDTVEKAEDEAKGEEDKLEEEAKQEEKEAEASPEGDEEAKDEKASPAPAAEVKEDKEVKDAKAPEPPKVPKAAPEPIPSFALLDIHGPVVVTYVYQLIDGEVKVEKMEFRKKLETGGPGAPGYVAPNAAAAVSAAGATPRRSAGVRY